eukprot:403377516
MPKSKRQTKKVEIDASDQLNEELKQESLIKQQNQSKSLTRSQRAAQRKTNPSRDQSADSANSDKKLSDNVTQSKSKTLRNQQDDEVQKQQNQKSRANPKAGNKPKRPPPKKSKIPDQPQSPNVEESKVEDQNNSQVNRDSNQNPNLMQILSSNQQKVKSTTLVNKSNANSNKKPSHQNRKQSLGGESQQSKANNANSRQTQLKITSSAHSSRNSKISFTNGDQQDQHLDPKVLNQSLQDLNNDHDQDNNDIIQNQLPSSDLNLKEDSHQDISNEQKLSHNELNQDSAQEQKQLAPVKVAANKKRQKSSAAKKQAGQPIKDPSPQVQVQNSKENQQLHSSQQSKSKLQKAEVHQEATQEVNLEKLLEQNLKNIEDRKKQEEEQKQKELESLQHRKDSNPQFLQWQMRSKIFINAIDNLIRKGVPQIYDSLEEFEKWQAKLITEELQNKIQQSMTEYEQDNGSSFDYFESNDFARVLRNFLGIYIEGSSLNNLNLVQHCYQKTEQKGLLQRFEGLEMYHFEILISKIASRKRYGIKLPNEKILTDENPKQMFSWELSENFYISEFASDNKVKKVRALRAILGKKIQLAQQILDQINDINTFENEDKLSKLNTDYQNYQQILMKEFQNDNLKRKKNQDGEELENKSENPKPQQNDQTLVNQSGKTSKSLLRLNESSRAKLVDEEVDPSEISQIQEPSQSMVKDLSNSSKQGQQPLPVNKQPTKDIKSFFPLIPVKKQTIDEAKQQLNLQMFKNSYITVKSQTIETEAKKQQQLYRFSDWQSNDSSGLIRVINEQKERQIQEVKALKQVTQSRLKHIELFNSAMCYNGDVFFKKSSVINCRNPFEQDAGCIDYDQGSDEEWQEIHCDNLEDDNLLAEEENSEMMQDDPELRQEGFIVADDYYSQRSDSSIQPDDYEDTGFVQRRRDLLKISLERQEHRMRSNIIQKPYIYTMENHDINDYKAFAFKKRVKLIPQATNTTDDQSRRESNISTFTNHNGLVSRTVLVQPYFPLKAIIDKKNQDDQKVEIKHYIQEIIELCHGSLQSKKQLIELLKQAHQDIAKKRIETFVRECFDKERRTPDTKTRLYAKVEVVERYGGDEQLIANMPLILEQKRDEEQKLRMQQPQPEDVQTASKKRSKRVSESNSQNNFQAYLQKSEEKDDSEVTDFKNDIPLSQHRYSQNNSKKQSKVNQKFGDTLMNESQADQLNYLLHTEQKADHSLRRKNGQSLVSFQDKSAFQSAQDDKHQEVQDISGFDDEDTFQQQQVVQQQTQNDISRDVDYTLNDIHLSQQGIVAIREGEHSFNISNESFCRNTQQCQSTPIANFKKLNPKGKKAKNEELKTDKPKSTTRQSRSKGGAAAANKNTSRNQSKTARGRSRKGQDALEESKVDVAMTENDESHAEQRIEYFTPSKNQDQPFYSQNAPDLRQLDNLSQNVNFDMSQISQYGQVLGSAYHHNNNNFSLSNFGGGNGLQSNNLTPNRSKRLEKMLQSIDQTMTDNGQPYAESNTMFEEQKSYSDNNQLLDITKTSKKQRDVSFGVTSQSMFSQSHVNEQSKSKQQQQQEQQHKFDEDDELNQAFSQNGHQ